MTIWLLSSKPRSTGRKTDITEYSERAVSLHFILKFSVACAHEHEKHVTVFTDL